MAQGPFVFEPTRRIQAHRKFGTLAPSPFIRWPSGNNCPHSQQPGPPRHRGADGRPSHRTAHARPRPLHPAGRRTVRHPGCVGAWVGAMQKSHLANADPWGMGDWFFLSDCLGFDLIPRDWQKKAPTKRPTNEFFSSSYLLSISPGFQSAPTGE